jgi:hypothetical protein
MTQRLTTDKEDALLREYATKADSWLAPGIQSGAYGLRVKSVTGKVVELGTYRGATTLSLCEAVGGDRVISYDTYEDNTSGYPGRGPTMTREDVAEHLSQFGHRPTLHRVDSVEAGRLYPRKDVAFLFVDTLHTQERVTAEFFAWAPSLLENAFVAFHDFDQYHTGVLAAVLGLLREDLVEWVRLRDSLLITRYKGA